MRNLIVLLAAAGILFAATFAYAETTTGTIVEMDAYRIGPLRLNLRNIDPLLAVHWLVHDLDFSRSRENPQVFARILETETV